MSNRTPRYRSWKKAYGGDPDSSILRDLHRRLMKVEIALDRAVARVGDQEDLLVAANQRIVYLRQLIDSLHNAPVGSTTMREGVLREPQDLN